MDINLIEKNYIKDLCCTFEQVRYINVVPSHGEKVV